MSEFTGKAGTIYIEKAYYDDRKPYEVWLEDFCILGDGASEQEALQEAARHTADISDLIKEAIAKVAIGVGAGE